MMKVELISYTQDAWNVLLGTKSTRMRGADPSTMTDAERHDHWAYMLDTIRSPFEFVDYIFQIEDVSKNFTHQLVRTRTGAYQQETSRALEQSAFDTVRPDAFAWPDDAAPDDEAGAEQSYLASCWDDAMAAADAHYRDAIARGAALQDARALLPSNMATKITAKFNLRTLSDMGKLRLCARTQGEYQKVFRAMRDAVLAVHPWADPLLQVHCAATGTCAFPRWGSKVIGSIPQDGVKENAWTKNVYQCPFYDSRMNLDELKAETRKKFWSAKMAEAAPVAHNGKSM
jgi:flavin-dependent thymidylate synthase